ncbi:hypothetical protein H2198_009196 [Neophaeococcomyces mojaviensis]|uniref:Uncharacterized protein n=1 Tax=Neophaeococcomyces mojaviensis TaxID=3383035 RepID=A0ACC2ZV60_9EURO|nr:hypothetical protein H2198_009196 [Knufia sp. JES_112]
MHASTLLKVPGLILTFTQLFTKTIAHPTDPVGALLSLPSELDTTDLTYTTRRDILIDEDEKGNPPKLTVNNHALNCMEDRQITLMC